MRIRAISFLTLVILTIPLVIGCSSGATGGTEVLHPLDAKAKARKEKKDSTASGVN